MLLYNGKLIQQYPNQENLSPDELAAAIQEHEETDIQ
jgi:hypothetical protein